MSKCIFQEHNQCNIYFEPLTREWYMDIQTGEWDSIDDDWIHQREYGIFYCPRTGVPLYDEGKCPRLKGE